MATRRMGQILGEIASLNDHDVEEVLQEQKVTHQRFGETALSLGLVQPHQVWNAWIQQLRTQPTRIDLSAVGVDAQAAQYLPIADAKRLHVVPLRVVGDQMVLAATQLPDEATVAYLAMRTGKYLAFGLADQDAIDAAIAKHYAAAVKAKSSVVFAA